MVQLEKFISVLEDKLGKIVEVISSTIKFEFKRGYHNENHSLLIKYIKILNMLSSQHLLITRLTRIISIR